MTDRTTLPSKPPIVNNDLIDPLPTDPAIDLVVDQFNGRVVPSPVDLPVLPGAPAHPGRTFMAGQGGRTPGLSKGAYLTKTRGGVESVSVFYHDVLVKRKREDLSYTDNPWLDCPRGGKRGVISEFNKGVARRMTWFIRNCPCLDVVGQTVMIHLTYPADFPLDGRFVKKHLDLMLKWLKYRGVVGVWVFEFQARGAPHFMLYCNHGVDKIELSQSWYRIVGSGDEKHLRAGTRCELLKFPHGAAGYAAKDAAKTEQKLIPYGFMGSGRFWGHWGVKVVPSVVKVGADAVALARSVRRADDAYRRLQNAERVKLNVDRELARDWIENSCMAGVPAEEWTREENRQWDRLRPLRLYRVGRKNRDSGCFSRRFYDGSKLVQ